MRDAHDRRAILGKVGDEQPGRDEGLDELHPRGRRGEPRQRRLLAGRRLIAERADGHQASKDGRQFPLHFLGKIRERRFCPLGQGAFHAANGLVGLEGQHAAVGAAVVKLVEGELQERQQRCVLRGLVAEHVVQPIALGLLLEAQTGGRCRFPHEQTDLGRAGRRKIVLTQALLQVGQFRHLGQGGVKVAPQRGDHPGLRERIAGQQRQQAGKFATVVRSRLVAGEQLFELIDEEQQSGLRLPGCFLGRLQNSGRLGDRSLDHHRGRGGGLAQRPGQLSCRGSVVGQFGQGLRMEQGGRERVENVAQAVARTKDHSPAEADAFDHAGTREGRQHAGPNERRLAAAAHAEHEEKGPPRFRLALEAIDHFADRLGAAEEDRFVLEVELLQAAEGRSVQPGWRQGDAGFRRDARGRQAAIDQLAEVVFDVLLEIVGAFEGVKRGDQGAFLVREPFLEEGFQGLDLAKGLGAALSVAQVGERFRRFAIDQQIGNAFLPSPFDRLHELEFRAGEVGPGGDVLGQARAQAGPQDADHDVGLAGRDQSFLEGLVRGERFVLPEDRLQFADVAVDVLQPDEDLFREEPLLGDIPRRGNEDLDGHERHRPGSRLAFVQATV